MKAKRRAGLLCSISSLSNTSGIGSLGPEAYEFAKFVRASGGSVWSWLPTTPLGYGNSPYSSLYTNDRNPLYISIDLLLQAGLLDRSDLVSQPHSGKRVNYDAARAFKTPLLVKAADRFRGGSEFEEFVGTHSQFQESGLFHALTSKFGQWQTWDQNLRDRDPSALAAATDEFSDSIRRHVIFQYFFHCQMNALLKFLNELGIEAVTDIPMYPARDGFDTWKYRELFQLKPDGTPSSVAGVPPDYFSKKRGQRWGNALFAWRAMLMSGFEWLINRVKNELAYGHKLRIDHFRALWKYWSILESEETAVNGEWVCAEGQRFLEALERSLGKPLSSCIIAEDLGIITAGVRNLRDRFNLPGMAVLQFAWDGKTDNLHLPYNLKRNVVLYTATHDNDTTIGWHTRPAQEGEDPRTLEAFRRRARRYINSSDPATIHLDTIRCAYASVADMVIIPVQDIAGLGYEARMNIPGTSQGNWEFRLEPRTLTSAHSSFLMELARAYGRN